MKTKIAAIAMLAISFGVKAQWNSSGNNSTTGSVTIQGGSVGEHFKRRFNYNGGGWARDLIEFENSLMVSGSFRIGSYGSSTDHTYTYFGYGNYSDIKNLRLYPNGDANFGANVGVGTVSPKAKFHISANENDRVLISNSTVNYNKNSPKLSFFGYTYGEQITGPSLQKISTGGYGQGRLAIFQHGGSDYTSEEEVMSILPNGNVGIGVKDPSSKLYVLGDGVFRAKDNSHGLSLHVRNTQGNNSFTLRGFNTKGQLRAQNGFPFEIQDTHGKIWFYGQPGGNVGIGTVDPGAWKLAVNGNIRAKEIKVETGWSDFVFYDDYKLPTLEEVETHIKEKGHLKDIPSAKEVADNGIFLGEMDSKLLQKIEELTLYTIEQEKKIKALEKEKFKNEKQQKEIEELKALVQKLLKEKN